MDNTNNTNDTGDIKETNLKFIFVNAEGKKEEVKLEDWIWSVVYKDNKELQQYEYNKDKELPGAFHQFKEIEQDKVRLFVMRNLKTGQRFDIVRPEGAQLFHFYRHCGSQRAEDTGEVIKFNKIYVFGYKLGKHTAYHYILKNNTLLIADGEINLENFGAFN